MLIELPKLRPLNLRWVQWEGQSVISLQDPLRLSEGVLMVAGPMAPLLGLLDGTRDLHGLRVGFQLRTGMSLSPSQIEGFIEGLDDALLLENQRFRDAMDQAIQSYRSAPFRAPALAGAEYPDDPAELQAALDSYCHEAGQEAGHDGEAPLGRVVGVISPHIDFPRGWRTYVATWQRARAAVEEADLIILLGTDHSGWPGSLTLTRQSYATPWGPLPTDTGLVDRLASILGEEEAFTLEVHHVGEHSIELASVWLHYIAGSKPKRLLPILCGPADTALTAGAGDRAPLGNALALLSEVAGQQNTLVVAAGDLSHVGPAFGDSLPLEADDKSRVHATDEQWLEVACSGSSDLLMDHVLLQGDATRICGAAPIQYMLAILPDSQGHVVAYDQCPADEQFGSLVSVAGVLYTA